MIQKLHAIVTLLRPSQWVKNGFVALPLLFAHEIADMQRLQAVALVAVAFCLLSSAIYAINDTVDREADREHPDKRDRPLASGQLSPRFAIGLAIALVVSSWLLALSVNPTVQWVLLAYLVSNLAYSLWLKQVAIVDVTIIGLGFVLRVLAGGLAAQVWISPWMLIMTFLLALLLAFGKRHDDLVNVPGQDRHRHSLKGYSPEFLSQAMTMMGGIVVVSYLLYTLSPVVIERHGTDSLYLTTIFVVVGVLRYLQQALVFRRAASPTRVLLQDHVLQGTILAWLISIVWIIYGSGLS